MATTAGCVAGDTVGRKPVIVFSAVMVTKALAANLLSSLPFFVLHDPNGVLLFVSGVLTSLASGGAPASTGMLVDIVPWELREVAFPVMNGGSSGRVVALRPAAILMATC